MKVLTRVELSDWFAQFPAPTCTDIHFDECGPFFTHPETNCIDLNYPPKLEQLPFFARYIATVGYDPTHFSGAILWFDKWGAWNDLDEGIGYRIIEGLHRGNGQPKSFEETPAHSFRADELFDAVGYLLQPMMFGWDAFHVPRWAYGDHEFFLHVSQDCFISVVTRTAEFYDRVFGKLQRLNLAPKAGSELRIRNFRRQT